MAGAALVGLAACGGGADYETTRDPLDFTVRNADEGNCMTNVGTVIDCDHEKARWRVVDHSYRATRPDDLETELKITIGPAISPYCSEFPQAVAASWENTYESYQSRNDNKESLYTVVCLERLKG